MKKALVATTTFPRWSNDSTPSFVFDLSRLISKKGYEVVIIAPHHAGSKKSEKIGKIKVKRFSYFFPAKLQRLCYDGGILPNIKKSFLAKIQVPFLMVSQYFSTKNLIKKEKFDVLHAHWIFPSGFLCTLLSKKYKIPLLLTIHGSDIFALRNIFFRWIQNFTLKHSSFVTVNSSATEMEIKRRFPNIDKIYKIPMGVDFSKFRKRKAIMGSYKGKKIILFVGRLSKQKGIEYLIKAMPNVIKKVKNAKLLIIGEGQTKPELERLKNEVNLKDSIEFLGSQPREKLIDYYNLSDVVVLPALSDKTGTEGLGLVLLEAMATKTAVIGSNIGGIKDIIEDNKTGLRVEQKNPDSLAKAIIKILENNNLRNRFSANGQKFVYKNYSWKTITDRFKDLYGKITRG